MAGFPAGRMMKGVSLGADEFTGQEGETWIGIGGLMKPVYPGSGEYIISYIPYSDKNLMLVNLSIRYLQKLLSTLALKAKPAEMLRFMNIAIFWHRKCSTSQASTTIKRGGGI